MDRLASVQDGFRLFQRKSELSLPIIILTIVVSLMIFFGSAACGGVHPPISPVVTTDKGDYQPGQTAIITGSGFHPREPVRLQVVHTNPVEKPGAGHELWHVAADTSGRFSSRWFVNPDDSLGASFLLTVVGVTSGLSTSTTFTDAAGPLTIAVGSQQTLWVDANMCSGEGPRGAWLSFIITNTGTDPATDVTVTFADFTGTNASYFSAPDDLTRTFSSIAAGAEEPVYFYVDYSEVCTHSQGGGSPYAGFTADYTVTATATGLVPVVYNGTVITDQLLNAKAAGLSLSTVLGSGFYVGQLLTQTVAYQFGNNTDLFFQPAGEAGFDAGCIRLVGSEITGVSGTVSPTLIGLKDRLWFPTVSVPGGGGNIYVTYTWEILCVNRVQTLHPWAAAKSGARYKYSGFQSSTILPASAQALTADKSVSPLSLVDDSGGAVTWTVTYSNPAPVPLRLSKITDVLPPCMSINDPDAPGSDVTAANSSGIPAVDATGTVDWIGNDLGDSPSSTYLVPAGGTTVLKYTTNILGCASPASYTNSATGTVGETTVGPAAATLEIGSQPAITLSKDASPRLYGTLGETITYTYTIVNSGNVTLDGPFTVNDSRLGTISLCGSGPILPGASTSCTAPYLITQADLDAGSVVNTATASTLYNGQTVTSNQALVTAGMLRSVKSVTDENGGNLEPGDSLLYTVVLQNRSGYAVDDLELTDVIPADTTYIASSVTHPGGSTVVSETPVLHIEGIDVPAHGQVTVTFRVVVDNPLPAGVTQITNQGTVFYDSDGDGTNDSTQQTDGDTAQPGEQSTDIPVTAGANFDETTKGVVLQTDADANGAVTPGDTLRYTVVIPNTGDQDATGVTFSDPVPANTTYIALSVTATAGTPTYNAGLDRIEWAGDITAGTSVTITFDVTVDSGIVVGTVLSNQGTVTYDSSTQLTDGDVTEPGRQPTDVTVGGMPEGVAIKGVTDENGGNLEPGDSLLYTVVLQNRSGYAVDDLELTDVIPADTTYIASSVTHPGGSTVVSETPVLHIEGIDVPAHGQVTVTFRVVVDNPLPAGVTQITNQGTVFYDSDGDGTNDSTQQTDGDTAQPGEQSTDIPVTAGANFDETTKGVVLQTDADANGAVTPGDTLRYTVVIPNTGDQDATGVTFSDPIPANTTYIALSVTATAGTATYNAGLDRIDWTGDITAGTSVTITFDVTVDSGIVVGTVLSNQGTVTYDSSTQLTDGDVTEPGRQPTDVTVGGMPEGVAIKGVTDENGGNLEPGDSLLYTVVLQNRSGFAVDDLGLTDAIPADTTYIASSVTHPGGSTVVSETPVLHIEGIDVPAHGQVTVTFRVVVDNPLPAGVTQITNQGTVFYDSDGDGTNDSTQQTDGDTAQPGEQSTDIPVTAGANFDETTKGVVLQTDADANGAVTPGDTLRYTVVIPNTGDQDATGVTFSDPVPANTTYIALSVTATAGTPTYNAGLDRIEWAGDITTGTSVTITFDVTVDSGIVVGTVLSNQGTVTYDSSTQLTDGDVTEPGRQPTDVTVGGMPEGVAIKGVTDENGGNLEPGDTLLYTVVLQNRSGFAVDDLGLTDAIPADTTYIASSVTHPGGSTVVSETPVLHIEGIDVPAHGQVTVTFRVVVDNPLPAGVTQITNQGTVFYDSDGDGTNDSTQQTDGDTSQPGEQSTDIPVTAGANFDETTKGVALQTDADADGAVTPGDTLRYTVVLHNTGNADSGVATVFADPVPFNTTYVTGSVTATAGTPTYNAGLNQIEWTGDVYAGGAVTITFDVTVDSGIVVERCSRTKGRYTTTATMTGRTTAPRRRTAM